MLKQSWLMKSSLLIGSIATILLIDNDINYQKFFVTHRFVFRTLLAYQIQQENRNTAENLSNLFELLHAVMSAI